MLTFLRRIRRSLIDPGSARKYLLYGIGEIALVVIGILIALQINNWNGKRQSSAKEKAYLRRLQVDLATDSTYFSQRFLESKDEASNYYKFIHDVHNIQKSEQDFRAVTSLLLLTSEHLTVENSTYLEMISAGKLDIIKNDSLKIAIIDLYRAYETIGKHIQEINEFTAHLLEEFTTTTFMQKYHSAFAPLYDQPHLFNDKEWKWINDPLSRQFRIAEATATSYHYKHVKFIDYFEGLLTEVQTVLKVIRTELSQ